MPERVPARLPTASRRTALGLVAAGAAALAAGCDAESPLPGGDDGGRSATPSPAAPQDADTRLVEQVRTEVVAALTAVRGARGRPAVADAVGALEAMHLAHLAALDGEDPGQPVPRRPGSAAEVRRRLAARERRHQQALARAADRAVSGNLAALLATMTAGTAQHLGLLS